MLEVLLVNDETVEVEGSAWHVDGDGGLHVRGRDKDNVASFAPTKWLGVLRVANSKR